MGEVELHVMAGRLQEAKRAAAARGELRTPLPVGYVHDEHALRLLPAEEVEHPLGEECGSVRVVRRQ
jgi:hypothetical protein